MEEQRRRSRVYTEAPRCRWPPRHLQLGPLRLDAPLRRPRVGQIRVQRAVRIGRSTPLAGRETSARCRRWSLPKRCESCSRQGLCSGIPSVRLLGQ